MPDAAVLAPLCLVAVFITSGVAKLQDADSTQTVVHLLRLPDSLQRRWFAIGHPVAEILLAVLLLSPWLALFLGVAIAALALCICYWLIIMRAMTFDPRPSCGCFGRIGDQRVNARTVARNTLLLLLAIASVAMAATGRTASTLLASSHVWSWVLGTAIVVGLALLIGGRSQPKRTRWYDRRQKRSESTPGEFDYVRTPIPQAILQLPDGSLRTLHELTSQRPQLLIGIPRLNILSGTDIPSIGVPGASEATADATSRLTTWRGRLPQVDVRLLSGVPLKTLTPHIPSCEVTHTLYDHGGIAWRALRLGPAASAVLLGADGLLAGGPVSGEDIEAFVDDIAHAFDSPAQDEPDAAVGAAT